MWIDVTKINVLGDLYTYYFNENVVFIVTVLDFLGIRVNESNYAVLYKNKKCVTFGSRLRLIVFLDANFALCAFRGR